MNKTINILCVYAFVLLFQSCKEQKGCQNLYEMEAVELDSSEPMFEDVLIGPFYRMEVVDNKVMLTYYISQGPSSESFQLLDEKTQKEIGHYGEGGYGPDNFLNPEAAGFSENKDTLYVVETVNNYLHKLVMNANTAMYSDDYFSKITFKDWIRLHKVIRLKNGYYLSLVGAGGKNLFVLLNQNGEIVKSFGEPPIPGTEGETPDYFSFNGEIAIHDKGFYFAIQNWAYIVKYDIDENLEPTLVWEKFYDEPIYGVDNSVVKVRRTTHMAFCGLAITDDYIFTSYSGVEFSESLKEDYDGNSMLPLYIVVMKHDGSVIGKIKVKERIADLAISTDKQYLYCKIYEPEVGIIRIPVKEIIKKCKK